MKIFLILLCFCFLINFSICEEEYYTVIPGDCLWNIAKSLLKDPWAWKEIWENNANIIENPDLIFPGQKIQIALLLSSKKIVFQENLVSEESLEESEKETNFQKNKPFKEIEIQEVCTNDLLGIIEQEKEIKSKNSISPELVNYISYIKKEGEEETWYGKITESLDEKSFFSLADYVYIEPKQGEILQKNESFIIFREEKEIFHPVSNQKIGNIILPLGKIKITESTEKLAKAQIIDARECILIGDKIKKFIKEDKEIYTQEILQDNGCILGLKDDVTLIGTPNIVFVDKGYMDGFKKEDILVVYRIEKEMIKELAQIEIILTQENTSTARIFKGKDIIKIGDFVKLKK